MTQGKSNTSEGINKVIYTAGDTLNSQDFILFIHENMLNKWKNDKSIPLIDVIAKWEIYTQTSKHGSNGLLDQPSKSTLENWFDTKKIDDIIIHILENGKEEHLNWKSGHDAKSFQDRSGKGSSMLHH